MKTKKVLILSTLLVFTFVLSACKLSLNLGQTAADSGFFVSPDKGETWVQKSEFLSVGGNRSYFKNTQSLFIKSDPKDPKALYMGTSEDGLFYSTDKGNSWSRTLIGKGTVHDLAIDPKFSCTMYAAVGGYLYKTIDCARHWNTVYTSDGVAINAVAVDYGNTNKIYVGLNDSRILKSEDAGVEWKTISTLTSAPQRAYPIQEIYINPKDSQKIYAATKQGGIFKSENEGYEWKNITSSIADSNKDISSLQIGAYRDMLIDLSKEDALFYVNSFGIFYTENGGSSWENIKLISKKSTAIYAIASNPKNSSEIYYTTSNLLYKSNDFGRNWSSKKLPTTKTVYDLLVDPENENSVFAVMRDLKK